MSCAELLTCGGVRVSFGSIADRETACAHTDARTHADTPIHADKHLDQESGLVSVGHEQDAVTAGQRHPLLKHCSSSNDRQRRHHEHTRKQTGHDLRRDFARIQGGA